MFGHDDENTHSSNLPDPMPGTNDLTSGAPATADSLVGSIPNDIITDTPGNYPTPTPGSGVQPSIMPSDDTPSAAPTDAPVASPAAPRTANNDELISLKQQALQQLSPLMEHLDQTPEEKFRTTMMMIQASDNDSLIRNAYDAALSIPDEKIRAQALLDVVNEINYFTQQDTPTTPPAVA